MTQTAKLTEPGGVAKDQFGTAVAVSGNTVAVGTYYDYASGNAVPAGETAPAIHLPAYGSAYVFTEPGSGWANSDTGCTLEASNYNNDDADGFGQSISVSGNTVVVGAQFATVGSNSFQGVAYLFTEPGSGWPSNLTQTADLTASDGAAGDDLGCSVAVSGNTVVVGASDAEVGVFWSQGAAYLFTEPGSAWANMTQTAKLTASDGASNDQFGTAVAIDGNTVVAAAPYATVKGNQNQGAAYVFETQANVTAVSTTVAAGSCFPLGGTVPITLTFSEAVNVSGTPKLTLNDGGTASYTSGSGGNTLTFTYPVAAGQNTTDLDYASTAALALNGGSIQDLAGNAAVLTLPATGSDGLASADIVIDTTPPTVAAISTTAAASPYSVGGIIPVTMAFNEAVNVSGTPQLTLNDGGTASYTSGSGGNTLTFTYTVAAGQNTADLDYASTAALDLNGGSIQDLAGNAAVLTLPATGSDGLPTANIVIDTTPPTVAAISTTAAASPYSVGGIIPVTMAFSEAVNVSGTPQLTLNDGGTANYTSGSGGNTLTFTYTVAAGQNTTDLDYASTAALALNAGSIQDLAGNAALLTLPATGSDGLATANIVVDTATLTVTAADWTSAGLTLTPGGDGDLHVYTTGTTTDVVVPCPPASVTNIQITAPGSTTANLTIDSTAGSPIPPGGLTYSGAGGLVITGSHAVMLSCANTYTGPTIVSAGTLLMNVVDGVPGCGSLAIGPGGTFIFDPSAGGTTIATSGDTSAKNTAAVATGAAFSSAVLLPPSTAGVSHCGRVARLPVAWPLRLPHAAPRTAHRVAPLPSGAGTSPRIAGDLVWAGQAALTSDSSDQHPKKDATILALEAVFAQYGR